MISYNFVKFIDSDKLTKEIKATLSSMSHIDTEGSNIKIYFPSALSQIQEDTLATLVTNHTRDSQLAYIQQVVKNAASFGHQLGMEFAAENVAMGITQAGKTKLIADTCQQAFYYLNTGSLYEARLEMLNLNITENMAPFLTTARRLAFVNKIEDYLGLPKSV